MGIFGFLRNEVAVAAREGKPLSSFLQEKRIQLLVQSGKDSQ
jgi:hypothetical protein